MRGPEVHPARIEERLHCKAFLDDAVGRAEEEDARPTRLPADRRLAHDEDAGAVQPDQEERRDRVQPLEGRRGPGEHLRDDRREEDEGEERTSIRVGRRHGDDVRRRILKGQGNKVAETTPLALSEGHFTTTTLDAMPKTRHAHPAHLPPRFNWSSLSTRSTSSRERITAR